jgi:site-specific DNA recombinase
LVTCGHCDSAITAELKKQKYIYYRCAQQCDGVSYVPESKLSLQLGEPLRRIAVTPEIVEWTREALLGSHADQMAHHRAALERLHSRRQKVTTYIDQAYTDRLEGRLPEDVWERRSTEWERERDEIARQIDAHEKAKGNYLVAGVKLLELAQVAYKLYVSQSPREQRRLVDVVLSNCRLRDGNLEYDLRKPFDLLVDVDDFAIWRGGRDLNPRPPA